MASGNDNGDLAARTEQHLAERDAAQQMAEALADSDTVSELLQDQSEDEHARHGSWPTRRRLLLGVLGLVAVALGSRKARRRR
jgi:hypothetical protein